MDVTLAAHHAELAQLRAQMASLRRDLLSAARAGTAAAQPTAQVDQVSQSSPPDLPLAAGCVTVPAAELS